MNRLESVMKIHLIEKFTWMYLPWLILFTSFVVNFLIGFLAGNGEPIYTGGIASIFIFMLVLGVLSLNQAFPFALGFSVRRTDFFFGTVMVVVLVSAAWSIVLILLSLIENQTGSWGVNLHFFRLPYLNDGSILKQLFVYFILFTQMYFVGFVITSVNKRFGQKGMIILVILTVLSSSILSFLASYYQWWGDIFLWISKQTVFNLAIWNVPLLIVFLLISYLLLRKATV